MTKNILIFFGPPGSGKGTQAELLCQELDWHKISVGELLRRELKLGSQIGEKARKYIVNGELVPVTLIDSLVKRNLEKHKNRSGFVFDGYPRNLEQNRDFFKIIKNIFNDTYDIHALEIYLDDSEVKERLENRLACVCGAVYHKKYNPPKHRDKCDICGKKLFIRSDDKPDVISRRLKLYQQKSEPLLKFWEESDKLIKINGEKSISSIRQSIKHKLKALKIIN